jgi:hypothetical protein
MPFPTLTNELCGDSADNESLPPISPGAEDNPLIPCLAKCARCRCKGVCLDTVGLGLLPPFPLTGLVGDSKGGVMVDLPTCIGGIPKRAVEDDETLRFIDCSYDELG